MTWQTYKKRNNPELWSLEWGMIVSPTLMKHGFLISKIENDDGEKPKKLVEEEYGHCSEVVYYPTISRDYHTKYIVVGYKI